MPEPKWLTTAQAADELGVTPGRVRQFIGDGRLPSQKVGRDRLIALDKLRKFQESHDRRAGRPWPSRSAPGQSSPTGDAPVILGPAALAS